MTRKITLEATNAFFAGKNYKQSNTEVLTFAGGLVELRLYGHTIAQYNKNNREIIFSLCGYNTLTTRERLKGLGINITTKKGQAYFNEKQITNNGYYESGIKA